MAAKKKLKTYSLKKRKNLVHVKDFAKLVEPDGTFREFFESLPKIYAADSFKKLARAVIRARRR